MQVQFGTQRCEKRIRWPQSKRLKSGTLVALTPADDMFKRSCIVAVVAARPLGQVEADPPSIDLWLADPSDIDLGIQREYIMIEASNGYFESYRHTMLALQRMYSER